MERIVPTVISLPPEGNMVAGSGDGFPRGGGSPVCSSLLPSPDKLMVGSLHLVLFGICKAPSFPFSTMFLARFGGLPISIVCG